ncbi:hypothetical protein I302_102255 [Kwoniella bestiolae CBS 10118]|uniref:Uncharacterized protein n=1 Tax=Kwoniella bestiolae CBS 10118 TaxID=1296100 RepID=A0A1B9GEL4_9TREE|nr:hypothetical protein I302_00944 [Kwoniella bestiolae CBS 10118]OCF29439.1 hypothetical protein I302_00944 [Kwoniella bestiolae CBS 10118]
MAVETEDFGQVAEEPTTEPALSAYKLCNARGFPVAFQFSAGSDSYGLFTKKTEGSSCGRNVEQSVYLAEDGMHYSKFSKEEMDGERSSGSPAYYRVAMKDGKIQIFHSVAGKEVNVTDANVLSSGGLNDGAEDISASDRAAGSRQAEDVHSEGQA